MVSVPPGQVEMVASDAADKMRGISEDLSSSLSDDAKLRLAIALGRRQALSVVATESSVDGGG
ncbi:MAG: hypothetical protein OXF65_05115 [Acidimicrobiaceae bacterium]|nr:hypothetical protein [Acidimicrobiaceae bacterium]